MLRVACFFYNGWNECNECCASLVFFTTDVTNETNAARCKKKVIRSPGLSFIVMMTTRSIRYIRFIRCKKR